MNQHLLSFLYVLVLVRQLHGGLLSVDAATTRNSRRSAAAVTRTLTATGNNTDKGASPADPDVQVAALATGLNPFFSGCLQAKFPDWTKKRVCNTEDPPIAAALGLCQARTDGYTYSEIRLFSYNWETAYFEVFLLQIILSELLDVPVTIEPGVPDLQVSMYDPLNRFDFPSYAESSKEDAVLNAQKYNQDCTLRGMTPENYEPCVHYFPEEWNAELDWIEDLVEEDVLDVPAPMGMLGFDGIFVPMFTANRVSRIMHTSIFGLGLAAWFLNAGSNLAGTVYSLLFGHDGGTKQTKAGRAFLDTHNMEGLLHYRFQFILSYS